MRISTLQTFESALSGVQNASREIAHTQQQISSNRRVLTPADDPVAAARVLKLSAESAQRDQYVKNINSVENALGLSDAALNQSIELLQRVRELTVQAGNGINTKGDRQIIAVEIKTRLDELVGVANTRNASGEYLFGGSVGGTAPFDAGDSFRYQGDQGQRQLAVSASSRVALTDSGHSVFVDVPSAEHTFSTRAHSNNDAASGASIGAGQVVDRAKFDAFYPDDLVIEFGALDALSPPQPNYTVRRLSDHRVVEQQEHIPYTGSADIAVAGVALRITGAPQAGDRFFAETSDRQSVFTTLSRLAEGLDTIGDAIDDPRRLTALIGVTLSSLENGVTNLLEVRSEVGARLNTADTTRELHSDVDLVSKKVLSELRDLDFAEAVSRLSAQSLVLEAAQKTFAKTAGLSLFNVI